MILQTTPKVGCAVLVVAYFAGGCHDFETVGILGMDAETHLENADAGGVGADVGGDARVESAADTGPSLVAINNCQGGSASGLDETTIAKLVESSVSAPITWLYPYDGTVFPGGLSAPLLMWDDGGVVEDAVFVHLHSSSFDYRGCMKPTAPGQLQFPQTIWTTAGGSTTGEADPFLLELRVLAGGQVLGSETEHVVIATGVLRGSVYYQTVGVGLGSVARVQPGQNAQPVLMTVGCVGCHSVSADGSRIIASVNNAGTSFALAGSTPTVVSSAPGGESPGLTPDGTLYLASAHPSGVGPKTYGAGLMTAGLYETMTGSLVPDSGVPTGAMVPTFSPDSRLLAFNDFAINGGKGLALMDFSEMARMASNYRIVFSDSVNYPAWPSFLPDGRTIVFQLGASAEFSGEGTGILQNATPGPQSDLLLIDATIQKATLLARAMGFASAADAASNNTYLPFGIGEAHQNYSPTVSPAASGGYAWVFFDSMRHYGNVGLLRGIWGCAVDAAENGVYASDPSHPAFFLPGQDIGTGNFRPVAALRP